MPKSSEPFILVLYKGDNLFKSIQQCAEKMDMTAASLSGLGALKEVTLAYYHLDQKQYATKLFPDNYELISLNGNIADAQGERIIHIHASLGDPDYRVWGGHVMDATIAVTAEITIIPFHKDLKREFHKDIGLKLLCPMV